MTDLPQKIMSSWLRCFNVQLEHGNKEISHHHPHQSSGVPVRRDPDFFSLFPSLPQSGLCFCFSFFFLFVCLFVGFLLVGFFFFFSCLVWVFNFGLGFFGFFSAPYWVYLIFESSIFPAVYLKRSCGLKEC